MARFTPVPGLDRQVAWMVAPEVHKVARQVEKVAKRLAPPGKTWVHMGDGAVRDTHREAGSHPTLPANLRFAVRGQEWDIAHGLSLGVDYMLEPKDTSGGLPYNPGGDDAAYGEHTGSAVQNVRCRCVAALHPTHLSKRIRTGPYKVIGTRVEVRVTCRAYKVIEAEYGDTYPSPIGPLVSEGTHFMGRAAAAVAGRPGVRGQPR